MKVRNKKTGREFEVESIRGEIDKDGNIRNGLIKVHAPEGIPSNECEVCRAIHPPRICYFPHFSLADIEQAITLHIEEPVHVEKAQV